MIDIKWHQLAHSVVIHLSSNNISFMMTQQIVDKAPLLELDLLKKDNQRMEVVTQKTKNTVAMVKVNKELITGQTGIEVDINNNEDKNAEVFENINKELTTFSENTKYQSNRVFWLFVVLAFLLLVLLWILFRN